VCKVTYFVVNNGKKQAKIKKNAKKKLQMWRDIQILLIIAKNFQALPMAK